MFSIFDRTFHCSAQREVTSLTRPMMLQRG